MPYSNKIKAIFKNLAQAGNRSVIYQRLERIRVMIQQVITQEILSNDVEEVKNQILRFIEILEIKQPTKMGGSLWRTIK